MKHSRHYEIPFSYTVSGIIINDDKEVVRDRCFLRDHIVLLTLMKARTHITICVGKPPKAATPWQVISVKSIIFVSSGGTSVSTGPSMDTRIW